MGNGHGFQFTPFGMLPLGAPVPDVAPDDVAGGSVGAAESRAVEAQVVISPTYAAPPKAPQDLLATIRSKPMTGKQIAALVRARVKEIDKLLATVPALEREREMLASILRSAAPKTRRKNAAVVPLKNGTSDSHD